MSHPSSRPPSDHGDSRSETDNQGMIYLYVEGNGDATIRPAQPITLLKRPLRPLQPTPPKSTEPDGPVAGS